MFVHERSLVLRSVASVVIIMIIIFKRVNFVNDNDILKDHM